MGKLSSSSCIHDKKHCRVIHVSNIFKRMEGREQTNKQKLLIREHFLNENKTTAMRLSPKMKFKVALHFIFHVSNVYYWTEMGKLFNTTSLCISRCTIAS